MLVPIITVNHLKSNIYYNLSSIALLVSVVDVPLPRKSLQCKRGVAKKKNKNLYQAVAL